MLFDYTSRYVHVDTRCTIGYNSIYHYEMPTLKAGKTQGGPVLRMPVWLRPKRSTARNGFCTCGWCHMLNPQTSSMTLNAFLRGYMFSLEMRWGLEE